MTKRINLLGTVGQDNDSVLVGFVGDVNGVGCGRWVDHRHVAGAAQGLLQMSNKCFKRH